MILWVFIILVMGLFMLFGTEYREQSCISHRIGDNAHMYRHRNKNGCSAKEGRQRKTCRKDKGT